MIWPDEQRPLHRLDGKFFRGDISTGTRPAKLIAFGEDHDRRQSASSSTVSYLFALGLYFILVEKWVQPLHGECGRALAFQSRGDGIADIINIAAGQTGQIDPTAAYHVDVEIIP